MEITKLQELNKSLQRQINDFEGKLGDALGQISKGKDNLKPKRKNTTLRFVCRLCKTMVITGIIIIFRCLVYPAIVG